MIQHWTLVWRAGTVGAAYLLMRLPLDLALMRSAGGMVLGAPILMSHLIGTALLVVLVYLTLYYKVQTLVRPWKCPVCDGHGFHYFVPGARAESDVRRTMETCHACGGKGYIWESAPKV